MHNDIVIGITGSIGAGKDTLANILVQQLPKFGIGVGSFSIFPFAKPLKDFLKDNFKLQDYQLYTQEGKHKLGWTGPVNKEEMLNNALEYWNPPISFKNPDKMVRAAWNRVFPDTKGKTIFQLQITPRDLLRLVGTEFFQSLDKLIHIDKVPQHGNIIIPDVRFDREAKYIKDRFGFIIEIVGVDNPDLKHKSDHESDKGVSFDYIDQIINNYYNFDMLNSYVVDYALEDIFKYFRVKTRVAP